MIRWLCLILFAGQLQGQIDVLAALDKDSLVIGDTVEMQVTIDIDPGVEVLGVYGYFLDSVYSSLQTINAVTDNGGDTIPRIADFVLIGHAGWQDQDGDGIYNRDESTWESKEVGGRRLLEQSFTYRLWDPGANIFLTPAVVYQQGDDIDVYSTEDQMRVYVIPPKGMAEATDSLQIAPIKNIISEPTNFSDYLIYFIIIGVALMIGLIYWLVSRYLANQKQKEEVIEEVEEVRLPPHVVALKKLSELEEDKMWEKGEVKKYQSELTYIIREYLEGRYSIAALESTTNEIISQLRTSLNSPQYETSLQRILQVADLVKFAKAKPDESVHISFLKEAEDFVYATKLDLEEISDEEE